MENSMMTKLTHSGGHAFMKEAAKSVSIPKVPPIYMSSVFSFDDVPSLDGVYAGTHEGYVYSRMANPGFDCLNDVISKAENCDGAIAFGSGMAAIITAIISCVQAGDHIISSPVLYGGVYDYLKNEICRFGVEVDFVDFINDDFEKYIKPNTKVIYTETITNPLMEVMDLKAISDKAHKHGLKVIVDNTFATMSICRPMEFGVDIVAYSSTKYLGGHSDLIGGIVASDAQTIAHMQRFATLYGGIPSPFDAWLLTRSMRTLDLRMRQHSENALALAKYLEQHPKIERIYYPGLESSEYHALAQAQFRNGWCGGMLSADFAGGEKDVCKFIESCETIKFVPSLASFSTSVSYPVRTSHRAYSPEELKKSGISMGQLRFSIGLENIDDVIGEMDKAFATL